MCKKQCREQIFYRDGIKHNKKILRIGTMNNIIILLFDMFNYILKDLNL